MLISTPPSSPTLADSGQGAPSMLVPHVGGIVKMVSLAQVEQDERRRAQMVQSQPYIQSLSAYVQQAWTVARLAKQMTVEDRMLKSIRQRRGEYDPDVLVNIRRQGGSEIYMMISSVKCRAAASWLRDTLLGMGKDKPWSVSPSPQPDMPKPTIEEIEEIVASQIMELLKQQLGTPTPEMIYDLKVITHDRMIEETKSRARKACERMENKMEAQLNEGHWFESLNAFIDDLTTYPAAIMKGPIVRKKPKIRWNSDAKAGYQLVVEDTFVLEWERVDPFDIYPSPGSSGINDGTLIQRHRLSRQALTDMRGVKGYDDDSINAVLEEFGRGGLREWLTNDTARAQAEGKSVTHVMQNPDGLIDAIQFWGSVPGSMLIEWGMKDGIRPRDEYQCEVWKVGRWIIKATLNPDPLRRRPYFKVSYEEVPGSFWGNSVCDLVRDVQSMCNSAARALSNNMGIASGPQAYVAVDRLPDGEDVTEMYPWKVWQTISDPMGGTQPPVGFFQPQSNAAELQGVFGYFSMLADEYSGVPRYMTGTEGTPGAGRTASGLSMMINNAGKSIKQVIANLDVGLFKPAVEWLYFYNMLYSEDMDLKGDVCVVARGANMLIVKEQAAVRRNEFLQLVLNSPIVQQVVGQQGIAALLREGADALDMDTDRIVPSPELIRYQQLVQKMTQTYQQMMQQALQTGTAPPAPQVAAPGAQPPTMQSPAQPTPQPPGSGQALMDGTHTTDSFQPS